jgi:hypothetical protein
MAKDPGNDWNVCHKCKRAAFPPPDGAGIRAERVVNTDPDTVVSRGQFATFDALCWSVIDQEQNRTPLAVGPEYWRAVI